MPPVTIVGRLSKAGERDEFTIAAPPGSKHEVRVEAWGLGSALDGQLRVFDKDGRLLGEADDGKGTGGRRGGGGGRRARGPFTTDPVFDLTMPAGQGEVKVVVKDLMDRGGVGFAYRLVVRPAETSFQLTLSDQPVAIPRGRTALIPVTVVRNGYAGPIELDVRGLLRDSGVTAIPTTVPAGQNSGVVGLKAAADSPFQALEAQVIGRGDKGQVVTASTSVVFAHQTMSTPGFGMGGTIPSYTRPFVSLAAAVTRPGPILLNPPGREARGTAREHRRGTGSGRVDGQGEEGVQARRTVAPGRSERGRVVDRRGRDECADQVHGGGGRAPRPGHGRPGRAGADPGQQRQSRR